MAFLFDRNAFILPLPNNIQLRSDISFLNSTRASYSGQVDGFRNRMKNELKTTAWLEIISNADANFLNLHFHKERKTHYDKQLY